MTLNEWAIKWGIPLHALTELAVEVLPPSVPGVSEAAVQVQVRLEASEKGLRLWRNNVGVLKDERGIPVRYGLVNESSQQNKLLKSSDLIGIRPVTITPAHVGTVVGQFVAREVKHGGWAYSGIGREEAQMRFIMLVNSMGGDAQFVTGRGTL